MSDISRVLSDISGVLSDVDETGEYNDQLNKKRDILALRARTLRTSSRRSENVMISLCLKGSAS